MNVVVLDYGSGNLRSAERAVARTGATVTVTADRDAALAADGLVLPGVGAFAACNCSTTPGQTAQPAARTPCSMPASNNTW